MGVFQSREEPFLLTNKNGVEVAFVSLGGRIFSVKVPDGKEKIDIVLGGDSQSDPFIGSLCGRFANRIANGTVKLDGEMINLPVNLSPNHIHGGIEGFNVKTWDVEPASLEGYESAFRLTLFSPDGEEGYPGNLDTEVLYALNDNNELLIDLKAKTDKTTIINLTVHPYFNLAGVENENVLNQELQIFADHYTPVDESGIPTGEIAEVSGTDLDFRAPVSLSRMPESNFPQVLMKRGLDHTWVLNRKTNILARACVLKDPVSGRAVEVFTTQPSLQVYTGNHFDGSQKEKGGKPLLRYSGIALEAQNIPDAPNKEHFPDAELRPGETYHEQIVYRFIF